MHLLLGTHVVGLPQVFRADDAPIRGGDWRFGYAGDLSGHLKFLGFSVSQYPQFHVVLCLAGKLKN
jgi:hypothetical protein